MNEAFEKLALIHASGIIWHCECPLGLWGVDGMDKEAVIQHGRYYFAQYYQDGEYTELLNNG